jgi:hypothetical protein
VVLKNSRSLAREVRCPIDHRFVRLARRFAGFARFAFALAFAGLGSFASLDFESAYAAAPIAAPAIALPMSDMVTPPFGR